MITVVGAVACVAIVAIFAMVFMGRQSAVQRGAAPPAAAGGTLRTETAGSGASLAAEAEAKELEMARLKSKDNQPLILSAVVKAIPPRPANPEALPEEDPLHWYDMEYAGWGVKKVNLPKSPANGPGGKRVVFLKASDHPYWKAVQTGMEKVAQVYGINLSQKVANGDINIQSQQVDQCLNERPDMVIMGPVEAKACVPLLRKLNEAGIPVIAINLLPAPEAHQYILSWTGPDDWGQFRLLARDFARRMNGEGGYCIVRHYPGWSPFFARTWSVITELGKAAPKMKMLAMQPTDLESEKTKDVVSGWLTRFGPELKGIVSCDDSGTQVGINEAVKNAGREDIIRVAAGNSKVGMDFVKEGKLHAITYQSPEADGAIPMKLAADWFYGKEIPPIRYLPIVIITKEIVEQYMPAQW
jgi:ribose transport system substrate-binding protein